ncbi:YczE/YyaS/YitT family protein [Sporomusa acidovorans]|uniref:YitT family protein n=1 Tax=Sporomusa acidovorans (strain ATCC 49682 / DSM 3132 / Mol) TaxID=1123286 RepID=A0ABZ3IXA9_SPOA4|nr:DUF6198 family protein [Sporomusa acidovorans]OZC15853.1 hypothetical protein SPACI_46730 [Sporomusa acidovorans DSM 3132]SDF29331.1 hypothetical protein SAMN04488499_10428 [Sporomusa acidovorans]
MSLLKRWLLFFCGLFFVALGISCIVKSMLGTAPISSTPYILSLRYPVSLGSFTFIVNMMFLLVQILILRRQFPYIQLLQIPMTAIFGCFIDLTMYMLSIVTPALYISKFITLLIGTTILALGVTLEIIGNVVVLPGEGIVNAISCHWNFDFGNTKTCVDTGIVLIAACLSWMYFGEIYGIREGTLISAFFTGSFSRFFIRHLSYIDKNGNRIFHLPFTSFEDTAEEKPSYQYH